MEDTAAPSEECLKDHVAVRWQDCIVVLCWDSDTIWREHEVWTYNLWTEQWKSQRNYVVCTNHGPEYSFEIFPSRGHCCVAIGSDIYMYGLNNFHIRGASFTAPLWKLTKINGFFEWDTINTNNSSNVPSLRKNHCAWEYGDKVWIFGGFGVSPALGYLNDQGDFAPGTRELGWNNQVLYYDPSNYTWTNALCSGNVPSPRQCASAAVIKNRVWLHGGIQRKSNDWYYDMYELNMEYLAWTQLDTNIPGYVASRGVSLTPITASQLALHAVSKIDSKRYNATWILDVHSYKWRQHSSSEHDYIWDFSTHTGTTGLNSDVIILGGDNTTGKNQGHSQQQTYNLVSLVTLEPKSLQQLSITEVSKHCTALPWKCLPQKLIVKIKGP